VLDAAPAFETAATNAPSGIGSLVASHGALEIQKLVSHEWDHALVARELYVDACHHRHYVTRLTRNPDCRFDHRTWAVLEVGAVTLAEALELGGATRSASELVVEREAFVGELTCLNCNRRWSTWKLLRALSIEDRVCARCGELSYPAGFDLVEHLSAERVSARRLRRPLFDFGLRPGDAFAIRTPGVETHYQLALGARERSDGARARTETGARIVLAGCGNIGSHVVPHLARIPGIGEVVLVDPDVYAKHNISGQDIRARDVGRAKVEVQAERLHEIRSELQVIAVVDHLERLPFAHFRDAFLVGALDSRGARQALNQVAWRAGSTWIDMAVDGPGLLCRVSVYRPGVGSPCLECGWDAADYGSLRRVLPCAEIVAKQNE
jgi:hypothetical protein